MKSIIIFGGSGYVGKNLIRSFSRKGYKIIVPYQKQINEANLRLLGSLGQIIPFHFSSLKNPKLLSLLNSVDICINLKTSWDPNKEKLMNSIYRFNADLINAIKKSPSICKFIFFSGLGAEKKRASVRNEIIFKTENLITKNLDNSIIIRPSVILGNEDQFLTNLIPVFKISFFIPLFGDGSKRFQPVLVGDVVNFVSRIVLDEKLTSELFELAGPEIFSYKEFYSLIAETMNKKRVLTPIPMSIIKPIIRIAEKTPFSPINSEQLSLFETDNVLNNNSDGFNYFEISPKNILSAIKKAI
jgi:uncharacterized protein YbjT (DUF2867 family)